MTIIDTHLHLWDLQRFDYAWITRGAPPLGRSFLVDEAARTLRDAGVGEAVFVQADGSVDEAEWVLSLTASHPWIRGVVGWIDLAAPDAAPTLARLAAHPRFRGVRAGGPEQDWLLADAVQPGLRTLAAHQLTLDVLAGPRELALLPRLAAAHPSLTIVLDHLGAPPLADGDDAMRTWRAALAAAAAAPNVVVKISGLLTQARGAPIEPAVRAAVDAFGPQRLLYGGDWPVALLAANYADTLLRLRRALAACGIDEHADMWANNARRIYRLAD
jgi:L-fuconolactonase